MSTVLVRAAIVAALAAACTVTAPSSSSPLSSPSARSTTPAAASPEVVCDASQLQPAPALACAPAIAAALAVLDPGHAPIVRETFRWGGLCPPGAPCAPPLGGDGIVIFDFASGPPVFVYVSSGADGGLAASSPAPYPSGY